MQSSFAYCFPKYNFRFTYDCSGVLISSSDSSQQINPGELEVWLIQFLEETVAFGPRLPPTRQERLNQQICEITAQTMIVLAILGWILPVMPGTPFFLAAWALGWRPPESKHIRSAE